LSTRGVTSADSSLTQLDSTSFSRPLTEPEIDASQDNCDDVVVTQTVGRRDWRLPGGRTVPKTMPSQSYIAAALRSQFCLPTSAQAHPNPRQLTTHPISNTASLRRRTQTPLRNATSGDLRNILLDHSHGRRDDPSTIQFRAHLWCPERRLVFLGFLGLGFDEVAEPDSGIDRAGGLLGEGGGRGRSGGFGVAVGG
jgi:hypothetical protein